MRYLSALLFLMSASLANAQWLWTFQSGEVDYSGKRIYGNERITVNQQFLAKARADGDQTLEARYLMYLGVIYLWDGNSPKANEYFDDCFAVYRKSGNRKLEAFSLSFIGDAYDLRKNREVALDYYQKSKAVSQQINDRSALGKILQRIGTFYNDSHENAKALANFREALTLFHAIGEADSEIITLNQLGVTYFWQGDLAKALSSFQQASKLNAEHPIETRPDKDSKQPKRNEALLAHNFAATYTALGDYKSARLQIDQCLKVSRELNDKYEEAHAQFRLGSVEASLGNAKEALAAFNQALSYWNQYPDSDRTAQILNAMGSFNMSQARPEKALEYFNRAWPVWRKNGNRSREAMVVHNIGSVHLALGDPTLALKFFHQSLSLAREVGDRKDEADALADLGKSYDSLDMRPIGIVFAKQSVNVYQTLRSEFRSLDAGLQKTYAETVADRYRSLADMLAAEGRIPEAQQVLDLLKDDEYFHLLRVRAGERPEKLDLTPVEARWAAEYAQLKEPVGKLGLERATLEAIVPGNRTEVQKARLLAIDAELAKASKAFQAFVAGMKETFAKSGADDNRLKDVEASGALSRTLAKLPHTAVVYTIVTGDHVRVILNVPGAKVVAQAPVKMPYAEFAKKVIAFRSALENPAKDPRPLGAELYDLLVRPIEPTLKDAKIETLLWSLDSMLRYVPLWALYDRDTGQYLVQKYPSALFTPRTVDRLAEAVAPAKSAQGFGVTDASSVLGLDGKAVSFPALPGVNAEMTALSDAFGTKALTNKAFTESALISALHDRPSILHIATHFRFKPGDEADSFLLLGGNGKLTLSAFKDLPDGCLEGVDLLVLSACETAVSSANADGSEFEGFSLLAQNKGAGAVMATLWPVSDDATAALMRIFYALRKANPEWTKLRCLRDAQLSLITDGGKSVPQGLRSTGTVVAGSDAPDWPKDQPRLSHPFYWAPFVLIGNSR